MFDTVHADLLQYLTRTRKVIHTRTLEGAIHYLSNPTTKPVAILVPDAYIADKKNAAVLTRIQDYVKYGGMVIFAGTFSSFMKPAVMNDFWKKWCKNWKYGDYDRLDTNYNRDEKGDLSTEYTDLTYSQKAVFLSDVKVDDAIYTASNAQKTRGIVQAPVVLSKSGDGMIGYMGDVNGERGSLGVVLAMVDLAVKRRGQ